MASSTVVKNFSDGSITIKDGTGTPISLSLRFDNGDFSISGLKKTLKETTAYQHRGVLSSVRHTTRTFPTFSFTGSVSELTSASANNLADAVLRNGAFASAVSTLGSSADVYTLDVTFTIEGTNFGDSADATFTLEDCELSLDFSDGDPMTFSVSGTVFGSVTGDLAI
jgi:hypothetical protein